MGEERPSSPLLPRLFGGTFALKQTPAFIHAECLCWTDTVRLTPTLSLKWRSCGPLSVLEFETLVQSKDGDLIHSKWDSLWSNTTWIFKSFLNSVVWPLNRSITRTVGKQSTNKFKQNLSKDRIFIGFKGQNCWHRVKNRFCLTGIDLRLHEIFFFFYIFVVGNYQALTSLEMRPNHLYVIYRL